MGNSFWRYVAVIFVAMIFGCGGNRTSNVSPAPTPQPDSGLLSLPAPVDALSLVPDRTTSALLLERNGCEYVAGLAQNTTNEEPSATFNPNWTEGTSTSDDLAYAIYSFNVQTYFGAEVISLSWGEAPPDLSNLWVGLGNWNRDTWDWYPGLPDGIIDLQAVGYGDYTQPGTGKMLVAVVMLGTQAALLDRLSVGAQGWQTQTVDSVSLVGYYTSLSVVNGNPAISYYGQSTLQFVRATNADGSSWGTPQTPESTTDTGMYTSLCVVDGKPAISYFDGADDDLKFVRATNADGSSWGTPLTLDSTGYVGTYTSLCIVDGNPAISYHDWTNSDLKYIRATNADGSSWETPQTLDSTSDVGLYTSLCVVDGNPAISYGPGLKYVRATNADGSTWGTPLTFGELCRYTSLCVVDNNPAISYWDQTNSDLKYVRATNADGSSWEIPLTLDSAGDVGRDTFLAVVDGKPAISYQDYTNDDLKYVRATNVDGSSWETPQTIDSTDEVGWGTSLCIVDGNPAISYQDITNYDLKFVRWY